MSHRRSTRAQPQASLRQQMARLDRRKFVSSLTIAGAGLTAGPSSAAPRPSAIATDEPTPPPTPQGALDLPGGGATEVARDLWTDPRLLNLTDVPWTKVHQDFHNSEHVPSIGDRFDAGEYGDTLVAASIDIMMVFAKDMHGYFYYPSRHGPVHPGLDFDLMKEQIAECRKRGIRTQAYYCCTWDHYLAERHQEWLLLNREREPLLPKWGQTPGWTALCLSRERFVQLMLDHVEEFISRYDLDGVWMDMPATVDAQCYCDECLRQIRAAGGDPLDLAAQAEHKHELYISFMQRVHEVVKRHKPRAQVEWNWQDLFGLKERIPWTDTIDIESVPTAFWGYYYTPLMIRYIRSFGIPCRGLTGRFLGFWSDFGGLKNEAQLSIETGSMIANAARCNIGDQPRPDARLHPAVYDVIGKVFGRVKRLEPYLDQAAPVTEAVFLVSGLPGTRPTAARDSGRRLSVEALHRRGIDHTLRQGAPLPWQMREPGDDDRRRNLGEVDAMTKLLLETRVQFDVMEPDGEWERYPMVVLEEDLPVEQALADRLHDYVEQGGAVLVSNESGLLKGEAESWLDRYGLSYHGRSEYAPAYLVPREAIVPDLPTYEYALYDGATQWRTRGAARVIASLGEPLFQRRAEHYTGHRQSPYDHDTDFAALACSGRVALFGFPIALTYYRSGYWAYRDVFRHLLRTVRPAPLIETDAPHHAEITVTRQEASAARRRPERCMVHIVNFSQSRRTPGSPDFFDDPIALTNVGIRVNLPLDVTRAHLAHANQDIAVRRAPGGGVEFVVPRVSTHDIAVLELA